MQPKLSELSDLPRVFVVVCTHLHVAHGLYAQADLALEVAAAMTADPTNPCTYAPVPLLVEGGHLVRVDEDTDPDAGYPGVYL